MRFDFRLLFESSEREISKLSNAPRCRGAIESAMIKPACPFVDCTDTSAALDLIARGLARASTLKSSNNHISWYLTHDDNITRPVSHTFRWGNSAAESHRNPVDLATRFVLL